MVGDSRSTSVLGIGVPEQRVVVCPSAKSRSRKLQLAFWVVVPVGHHFDAWHQVKRIEPGLAVSIEQSVKEGPSGGHDLYNRNRLARLES